MSAKNQIHFYKRLNRIRKIVQVLVILFFILIPILNGFDINFVLGTLYSLSIGELDITDPVMVLQTILLTKNIYVPLLIAALLPIIIAFIFGKVFCSWICPHNTVTEWITSLQKKWFSKRWRREHHYKRGKNPNAVFYWTILAVLSIAMLILGFPLLSYLSFPGIITTSISQGILNMSIGIEILLIVLILMVEAALFRRFWCKYACPVGAFLALFRNRNTMHVSFDSAICNCKAGTTPCYSTCPLHLAPKELPTLYPYCINCGLCISFCENAGRALSLQFGDSKKTSGNLQLSK